MMPFVFMSVHLAETAYFKQKAGIQGFLLNISKIWQKTTPTLDKICRNMYHCAINLFAGD